MQKAEPQHNQTQNQPAQRQSGSAALESPQGEQIAQFEAMADESPQADRLAQLAVMANNSPRMAAQRKAVSAIHNSPHVAAQRQQLDSLTGETAQREETEEPLQAKVVQREAAPAKSNNTGLPDNLKSGIESLSGMSMDSVKVHYNSSQPAQLNALAYAQGTDIHVAPGQEQHLPHEAWHVVQQAQGRVKPTIQMKDGVPINDDAGLEREADVMGGRAVQMADGQKIRLDPIALAGATRCSANIQLAKTSTTIQFARDFAARYELADERGADMGYEAVSNVSHEPSVVPAVPAPEDIEEDSKGYLVNIATIPGGDPNTVVNQYLSQGFANQNMASSRMGMVIGVNKYKSLSGLSAGQVTASVNQLGQSAIKSAAFGFTWKQKWQSLNPLQDPNTWDGAKAAYDQQDADIQQQIQKDEKANISQATIPYGPIKEKVTASAYSKAIVDYLSNYNEYVYIQLADDDAVSIRGNDADDNLKAEDGLLVDHLFDRYDHVLNQHNHPTILVGGYEFRLNNSGDGEHGNLLAINLDNQLLAIANQIDIAIRMAATTVNNDYAYPTEPNMVMLAKYLPASFNAGMGNDGSDFDMYRDLKDGNNGAMFNPDGSIANEGYLFGAGAREGQKLRKNFQRGINNANLNVSNPYDPRVAIATDSDRFGLGDNDELGGKKGAPKHSVGRDAAAALGLGQYQARIVSDISSQSQNFVGNGLKVSLNMAFNNGDPKKLNGGNLNALKTRISALILAKITNPGTALNDQNLFLNLNNANARAIATAIQTKFNTMDHIWVELARIIQEKHREYEEREVSSAITAMFS